MQQILYHQKKEMKNTRLYLLFFFISLSICNSLDAQENPQSLKFARSAVLVDGFAGATGGVSINWHQPLMVFKKKNDKSSKPDIKGYLNASIGFGLSVFPEEGSYIPHSLTFNFSIQKLTNKAKFLELGYTGLDWQAKDKKSNYNNKNEYGGGLLMGYRSNGALSKRNTFVFRANTGFQISKDQALGKFCVLECPKPTNKYVVSPFISLSAGLGF
jgi:hypothetical protein